MNQETAMQQRRAACRACEHCIVGIYGIECAIMITDCQGPACVQKLEEAVRRGICPLGKFDAVNMEARR